MNDIERAQKYSVAYKLWLRGEGELPATIDLYNADLRNADLGYANLYNANLGGVLMNWESHELIGERLRQAAGERYERLALAGAISQNTRLCWDYWLTRTPHDVREWALRTMATWVKDGDGAPDAVLAYVESKGE